MTMTIHTNSATLFPWKESPEGGHRFFTASDVAHRDRVQCRRKQAAATKRAEQQRLRRRSKRSSVRLHRRH